MKNYCLLLFFLFSASAGAQFIDSAAVFIYPDSTAADTSARSDSLTAPDSALTAIDSSYAAPEIITPLYQQPFDQRDRFIAKNEFYRRSLINTYDIFSLTPFFFGASHGLSGYPDNTLIYGTGSSLSSFLVNGLSVNDYSDIPFDLNRLQTEYIDSVEVIPLPRGFLYGTENNLAAVNFIGKDYLSAVPNTRIRYSEGPFGEAAIDGIFNSIVFSRFNLFVEISNKKSDIRYINTDYGQWNARAQLKFLYNNNINFISGYSYSSVNTGASGGIDVLNMDIDEAGFYEALYNEISSPVVYPELRYNTYGHMVFLKGLASTGSRFFTDAAVYYRFNRFELNGTAGSAGYLDNLYKDKIIGASLNQDLYLDHLKFKFLANFESADVKDFSGFTGNRTISTLSVQRLNAAVIVSTSLLDSVLHPSVFYKISSEKINNTDDYSGFGADITISLPPGLKLYAGYSRLKGRNLKQYADNFQASASYSHGSFRAGISYFSREGEINYTWPDTILYLNSTAYYPSGIKGLSLDLNIRISGILLEGKVDYYKQSGTDLPGLFPSTYINGGAYYMDSLFSGNLDLKAGLNISFYDRRNLRLSPQLFYLYQGSTAGPDFTLNFFVSGEIQSRAIVFFSWENLLDEQYFIIPFYPMPPRGIRFGVSWDLFN